MVKIEQQLVPAQHRNVNSGTNNQTGVTIHDTGNTGRGADAQAHANLQSRGNSRQASWHIQVDDKRAIQSYRYSDRVWHGGNNKANNDRVSIEICINSDGNYKKAVENAADVAAQVLKDIGCTPNDLDQHATYPQAPTNWTKNCPAGIRRGRDGINWNAFVAMVRAAYNGNSVSTPPASGGSSTSNGRQPYSHDQAAQEVIDGKWGNMPERKTRLEAAGFVYNSVQRRVNALLSGNSSSSSSNSTPARKTESQVAADIANGRGGWGNEPDRSRKLRAAGYNAGNVQKRVNSILLGGKNATTKPSVDTIARQIVNGQGNWGNEPERSRKLTAAGYKPQLVQNRVNQLLR